MYLYLYPSTPLVSQSLAPRSLDDSLTHSHLARSLKKKLRPMLTAAEKSEEGRRPIQRVPQTDNALVLADPEGKRQTQEFKFNRMFGPKSKCSYYQ